MAQETTLVAFDGLRTPIPAEGVRSGVSIVLQVEVQPSESPGTYLLELTLLQEIAHWFDEAGIATTKIQIEVVAAF